MKRIAALVLLGAAPLTALASSQILPGTCAPTSSNVGEYIRTWIFCGVSLEAPADTMMGALSLIMNVVLFGLALAVSILTALKYLWATTAQGSLGGERLQGMFGVMKVATVYAMLLPVISNGFSPIQLAYNKLVGASLVIGDYAASTAAKYMTTKGPITLTPMMGLDQITYKIVEFETCSQVVQAFHESDFVNGIDNPRHDLIEVSPTASSDAVTLSWDYIDPQAHDKGFFARNYSTKALCGELKISLPAPVADNMRFEGGFLNQNSLMEYAPSGAKTLLKSPIAGVSNSAITFQNLNRPGEEFAQIMNAQYVALRSHIARVSNIVASATSDILSVNALASRRTSSSDINTVENGYSQLDSIVTAASTATDSIGSRIAESHMQFVADMERSAAGAAQAAATLGTRRYLCLPNMGDCSEEEVSWADEIEEHGFVVFGAYYTKMSAHAKAAMEAQKSFVENPGSSALSGDLESYPKPLRTIFESEPARELAGRLNTYQTNANRALNINRFVDNFDNLSSNGKSIKKDEQNVLEYAREIVQDRFADLTRLVASTFSSNQSGGNVITRLVTIANYLAIAGGLLLAAFGIIFAATNNLVSRTVTTIAGLNGAGSLIQRALGLLFWTAITMLVVGSLAATILPMLPIIKWVIEIFSLALMFIMGLFYVPIWAFAFTVGATDDRLMTENTMSGWGLMIETLLRPPLLVISFVAFIALMSVTDIGLGLIGAALIGLMRDTAPVGAFTTIIGIFLLMYVGFQFVIRSIDTISTFADQIIKRASFGTQPLGDGAGEGVSAKTTAIFLTTPYSALQRGAGNMAIRKLSNIGTKA